MSEKENQNTKPSFGWEEVAKHNTAESLWIIYGTKVYDITKFLEKHPGGKEMILISAGKDCTNLIPSYHPFTNGPDEILKSYYIGEVKNFQFPQYTPDSGFFKELKEKVGNYFKEKKIKPRSPPFFSGLFLIYFLVFPLLVISWLLYATNYFGELNIYYRILASVLYGWCQVMPLLHIMHDTSHTAFGNRPHK